MRHDHVIEGSAYRLRPANDLDADFIIALRTDPALTRFLPRVQASRENQLAWFASYYKKPGDYYFVIERREGDVAEGTVGLYDVGKEPAGAEWGRWVLRPGSLAAVESALLIYQFGFVSLALKHIYCRSFADNLSVLSIHDRSGARQRGVLPNYFMRDGQTVDAVEHVLDAGQWPSLQANFGALAKRTASLLMRK